MASVNDYITQAAPLWTGQIGTGGVTDDSVETIPLASVTGLTNGEVYYATINRVDSNGTLTPNKREVVKGLLSGSNLTDCVRGAEGTAQAHNAGDVVEILFTAAQWNALKTGLLVEHNEDGTHDSSIIAELAGAQTFTGAKTFGANLLIATTPQLTTPKVITSLNDTNGNEVLKITATASAVNELTLANGATGANAVLSATGETNTGLDLKMKGTGKFRRPTIVELPVGNASTNLSTGDAQAFFRVPEELNGMNLTGVAASVYDAGTTNTLDIQIRNKTQTADMLSTKLTIDSGETDSSTAATPAVIDTDNDDVATGDIIAIDIDAVHTTPAKGLVVSMRFELP